MALAVELVAGRLIARHLGSSLYTWTSVIGVVLAGITIGNYIGGRIADRFAARKTLAVLFGVSSAACVAIVVLNNVVGEWIWLWQLSWPVRVFSHVALVFLLPSALLGMISPVVAKMALDLGFATGRTVGDIYAWGAAGSIAGTFLAGFYLIAAMGTIAIIWLVGGILLLMGILYWAKLWLLYLWGLIFIALAILAMSGTAWAQEIGAGIALRPPFDPALLYEDESEYCYVAVRRTGTNPETREFIQDKLKHSEIRMDDVTKLQYFYTNIYAGFAHALSEGKSNLNMMVIGGGGYAYPQYLEKNWPGSDIEVVEIDPAVTEAATQAFGLSRNTKIRTVSMDARNYVDQLLEKERATGEQKRYDLIYEDAINDYSVPFQLVTREFNQKIYTILAGDGLYMVNLIDTSENGQFLGAVISTIEETFDYVHVVTGRMTLPSLRNTFVVAAGKQPFDPDAIFADYNDNLGIWHLSESDIEPLKEKSHGIILTDDYAPVENLLAPVVRQSAKEILARKYLQQGEELKQSGNLQQAKTRFQDAVELNPSMAIKAYNEIGLIEVGQGNLEGAKQAFQCAIDYHDSSEGSQNIIGSLHLNMAILLKQMGQNTESGRHFAQAIEQFRVQVAENPESELTWVRLGDTCAMVGDFKGASEAFKKALELNPSEPTNYDNLAKAYEYQGLYDKALSVLEDALKLLKSQGNTESAVQLERYIANLKNTNEQNNRR